MKKILAENKTFYYKMVLRCFKESNNYSLNKTESIQNLIKFKHDNLLYNIDKILQKIKHQNKSEYLIEIIDRFLYINFNIQKHLLFFLNKEKKLDDFITIYKKNKHINFYEIPICDFIYKILVNDTYDNLWNEYLMKLLIKHKNDSHKQ